MDFSFQRAYKRQDPRGSQSSSTCIECTHFRNILNPSRDLHGYLISLGASRSNPNAIVYACLLCDTEFKVAQGRQSSL